MIYRRPPDDDPIDQGDLILGCPVLDIGAFDLDAEDGVRVNYSQSRVLVLTQTCDFANEKVSLAVTAVVLDAQELVDERLLKLSYIRGPIRAGRVFGWYFLLKNSDLGLPEMIVDFRQLHTVRLDLFTELCRRGNRKARVQPLYLEHLAKHFADTYSRIGLPAPYETD